MKGSFIGKQMTNWKEEEWRQFRMQLETSFGMTWREEEWRQFRMYLGATFAGRVMTTWNDEEWRQFRIQLEKNSATKETGNWKHEEWSQSREQIEDWKDNSAIALSNSGPHSQGTFVLNNQFKGPVHCEMFYKDKGWLQFRSELKGSFTGKQMINWKEEEWRQFRVQLEARFAGKEISWREEEWHQFRMYLEATFAGKVMTNWNDEEWRQVRIQLEKNFGSTYSGPHSRGTLVFNVYKGPTNFAKSFIKTTNGANSAYN